MDVFVFASYWIIIYLTKSKSRAIPSNIHLPTLILRVPRATCLKIKTVFYIMREEDDSILHKHKKLNVQTSV